MIRNKSNANPAASTISTDGPLPKIRKVSFSKEMRFSNSSFTVSEIDTASEHYKDMYPRLELGYFLGRLHVLIERKAANGPNDVFRIPFEALSLLMTYEDNPHSRVAEITVNGVSRQVPAS